MSGIRRNGIVRGEVSLWNGVTPNDVHIDWVIRSYASYYSEIESPKFSFSKANWTLSLQGNGNWIFTSSEIDLYLKCETPSKTVYDMTMNCEFKDDLYTPVLSAQFKADFKLKDYWGYHIVAGDVENLSLLLERNFLIIKYELHLNGKSEEQDTQLCRRLSGFSICDENCSLMKTFGETFGKKEFSDIMVRVGEEEIPAHKIILASRSKVFRAMLSNDMKEIQDGAIDLKDIDTSVAKEMFRFMYTDNIEALSFEKTLELYVAADRYDLQSLRQKCRDFLMEHLSAENVCEVIAVADLHLDDVLAVRSREFFYTNFKNVLQTEKWSSLENENLRFCYSLVKELLD